MFTQYNEGVKVIIIIMELWSHVMKSIMKYSQINQIMYFAVKRASCTEHLQMNKIAYILSATLAPNSWGWRSFFRLTDPKTHGHLRVSVRVHRKP